MTAAAGIARTGVDRIKQQTLVADSACAGMTAHMPDREGPQNTIATAAMLFPNGQTV
jgi:hypothetical protein